MSILMDNRYFWTKMYQQHYMEELSFKSNIFVSFIIDVLYLYNICFQVETASKFQRAA